MRSIVDKSLASQLLVAIGKIDRPGSFCVQGSRPAILPGLEVEGIGPVGMPLVSTQAGELKRKCEQAPYGKGTETLVDTSVRRVWRLEPERFALANPDWDRFVADIVEHVQQELGLATKLTAHLYDLLLYEPGSFFLPHKDGEKLDGMVATLVVVLPSQHEGGALVVRHDGREQVVDFGAAKNPFHILYTAFYADCEHEVRPITKGYRLCLVYNLTLGKGTPGLKAPRAAEHINEVVGLLEKWAADPNADKLVVTLDHEYTSNGIAWTSLKGADCAVADVLAEAAQRTGCKAYLGLLTLSESGSAEPTCGDDYGYRRRGRRYEDDEDSGPHEMQEVYDTSLKFENAADRAGIRMPCKTLSIDENENLLDPEALRLVDPEEEFEGYTGNAGMTLDRWYRHAAIVIWPEARHFDVICGQSLQGGVEILKEMVEPLASGGDKNAQPLKSKCLELAGTILARWLPNDYGSSSPQRNAVGEELFELLIALEDLPLILVYVNELMAKDVTLDPGPSLVGVIAKHGWQQFATALMQLFARTMQSSVVRNIGLLEHIADADPGNHEGFSAFCQQLATDLTAAVERIDRETPVHDWRLPKLDRRQLLVGMVRALISSHQPNLLRRLIKHALADSTHYPLATHLAAQNVLRPWLKANAAAVHAELAVWFSACRQQLELKCADIPKEPTDFKRAGSKCNCKLCAELNAFLADPHMEVHRFKAVQDERSHLENSIQQSSCDVDVHTERTRPSHTLVCKKNTNTYKTALQMHMCDLASLAELNELEREVLGQGSTQ